MVFPPQPNTISVSATIAGSSLQSETSSVVVTDAGFPDAVVTKTNDKLALLVTGDQRVAVNTSRTEGMLTVNNDTSTTPTIRMSYQNKYFYDGWIDSAGNATFAHSSTFTVATSPIPSTIFKKNVNIADHDGMTTGLNLGGVIVTASASELNYVDVSTGVATARKAVVLDGNKSVAGLGTVSANTLGGVLSTASQPNITTLNKINVTDEFSIGGVAISIDPTKFAYIDVATTGAANANQALIADANKNINGINSLKAVSLTGTLTAGLQPNIMSVGDLNSLSVTGSTTLSAGATISTSQTAPLKLPNGSDSLKTSSIYTNPSGDMVLLSTSGVVRIADNQTLDVIGHDGSSIGLKLGGTLVTATGDQLNHVDVVAGAAAASKALILDANRSITNVGSFTAEKVYSEIMTPAQPNIASVTTLDITGHDGSSRGLMLNGLLVTATADQLNRLSVSKGTASGGKALVVDDSKNIVGLNAVSSTYLAGAILTSSQPYISSVTNLTIAGHDGSSAGLTLGEVLVTATGAQLNSVAVAPGTAAGSKAVVLDSSKNVAGINDFAANNIYGLVQTSAQPNITSVNTLNIASHDGVGIGLSLNGVLLKATAAQLNALASSNGIAAENKVIILDGSRSIAGINNLSASTIGGLISDAYQPNITSVDTLDIATHDGVKGLKLNGTLVTSSAHQLNYTTVDQGVGTAGKAMVLDGFRNIDNINVLSASGLSGTIQTPSQPLITRVNTLNIANHNGSTTGLSLNGVLLTATAEQLNQMNVTAGIALENKVMVVDGSRNIKQLNIVAANKFEGLVSTGAQPYITEVRTLNVSDHNGTTTGLSLNGTLVTVTGSELNKLKTTAGSAEAGCAVIVDSVRSIQNINALKATTLSGTLQTSFQPNITKVETLNIDSHDGGVQGLSLNGTLVSAGARQLNYTNVVPGSATAQRALVTNEFNSITGINNLQATKLTADTFVINGVISNFSTGGLLIKSYSFTDLNGRLIDIQIIPSLKFTNFQPESKTDGYSCEIIGYILPRFAETYTFYVACNDRVRLWVNNEPILHSWTKMSSTRASSNIFLNAEQWVPIYIQYQVDVGSTSTFSLEWMSTSTARGAIVPARMAWDNNPPARVSKPAFDSQITIFNPSTAAANTTVLKVDSAGDLTIDASGNDIYLGSADNFDIPSHDGKTLGLRLAGVLVLPTAYELNYLKVSPGSASESHALVVDSNKSISGINSMTATTISCQNLSTNAFSINNLALSGPLNNYSVGGLICRQITGTNFQGRVVNVGIISDINLSGYDPKELNTNFSIDIMGYVLPAYTELYRFYAITNDKIRIWVDDVLVLNNWSAGSFLEYTSDAISLTAGKWTKLYIQFQAKDASSKLIMRWSSTSLIKSVVGGSSLAWDNTVSCPIGIGHAADRFTLFSSKNDLTSPQRGHITIDDLGNLQMSSTGHNINIATGNSIDVVGHNGTTGLKLAGNLVAASAFELNYLSGVTPGAVLASKAIVLNSMRALAGFSSISSTEFVGTLATQEQPNITSIGALSSELKCESAMSVTNGASGTNSLKLSANSTTSFIQTMTASDVFIGNIDRTIDESTRKFIIKSSGNVGIQTSAPTLPLVVNDNGQDSCVRLVRDNSNGTESTFCDIGVGVDGALELKSNVRIYAADAAGDIAVSDAGVLNVSSQSGVVQVGTAANAELPLEIGAMAYNVDSRVGYINADGSVGTTVPASSSYSMRTDGSIIVNGTVCVTSDRRLKTDIQEMDSERCRRFILESNPVSFKYRSSTTQHYGLIAQEVAQTEFSDIVNVAPHAGLQSETDDSGVLSPANAAMNVSYESIIPILMSTMKETMRENSQLKEKMETLEARLSALEKV